MADLPASLQRSLTATATLAVAELFSEGKSAANDPEEWPLARISERLDGRACPLCAAVHGKIVAVGSEAYRKWRAPSHINCRRVMEYLHRDEAGAAVTFEEPDPELVRKHGHYHLRPERHAELRVPAEPAGRHFIVRRVKHAETGEVRTVLDWAPWWEQVPQWKRRLVLRARVASEAELPGLLERLGITDPAEPEQARQLTLLGLRDRVEGWLTTRYAVPDEMALPGDIARFLEGVIREARNQPLVRAERREERFASLEEAEEWARRNLPGIQIVDYSETTLEVATALNEVGLEVCEAFGVTITEIRTYEALGIAQHGRGLMGALPGGRIGYNPNTVGPIVADAAEYFFQTLEHTSAATRDFRSLAAHEMAHLLQRSGRTTLGAELGGERSEERVREIVNAFRQRQGEQRIRRELGDRAWDGDERQPGQEWKETWAEAFSAYWIEPRSLSRAARRMVDRVLRELFPDRLNPRN